MKPPLPRPLTNTEWTINLSQLRLTQRVIDSTILIFFSAGITGGLDIDIDSLRQGPIIR